LNEATHTGGYSYLDPVTMLTLPQPIDAIRFSFCFQAILYTCGTNEQSRHLLARNPCYSLQHKRFNFIVEFVANIDYYTHCPGHGEQLHSPTGLYCTTNTSSAPVAMSCGREIERERERVNREG